MRTLSSAFLLALSLLGCASNSTKSLSPPNGNAEGNRQASANASPVGGQTLRWEEQRISFTVPSNWRRHQTSVESLWVKGPDDLQLTCTVLRRDKDYPIEAQLKYEYEAELERGEPERDVRYLELDGLKGIHWRSVTPVEGVPYSFLTWRTFRRHQEEVQLVEVSLAGPTDSFTRDQAKLYGILHSLKLSRQ